MLCVQGLLRGMVARLPSLRRVWAVSPDVVLAAKAAGKRFDADFRKGLRIARYCAMLCS